MWKRSQMWDRSSSGLDCYGCYFFLLFFTLFQSYLMHLYPSYGLSHFLHPVIILSHRHFIIFPFLLHVTNGNIPWSRSLHSSLLPTFTSILCKAMFHFHLHLFISWLCHSLFNLCYAFILEAVCLTLLITVYDLPSLPWVQGMDLYDMYQ